ncbi:MAG: AIPR family protein [Bacteroidota bacterium]|nr:AIPR family protein [Bacteroidota bacterium]
MGHNGNITSGMIDKAQRELKAVHGGSRKEYFGLLYLEKIHGVPRENAVRQIAFGGNEYGIDGFHFDGSKKNFYVFQFRDNDRCAVFRKPLRQLIDVGMDLVFDPGRGGEKRNGFLRSLRSCLFDNINIIGQVCLHFVFTGDPSEAERSSVLERLQEELEAKKSLIDRFFEGRKVRFLIEFLSPHGAGVIHPPTREYRYTIDFPDPLERSGAGGEKLSVGFVRLMDLHRMYEGLGGQFFEWNIRGALPESETVNRALMDAFRRIILEGKEEPSVFSFNHNGVTLAADRVERDDGRVTVDHPRLLNGAQTVITFTRFLDRHGDTIRTAEAERLLRSIYVLCKFVSSAAREFITSVTVCNNRQTPVEPWNLRSNDMIQLELQDKFREELGVYYERQEKAFSGLSEEEFEELGVDPKRPVEMLKLAATFLASDGDVHNMSSMRHAFEDEHIYSKIFSPARLRVDAHRILLCYKVQFRLRKLVNDIVEKGPNKYWFLSRARNLLFALMCQALLNDPRLDELAEAYGADMSVPAGYTETLSTLATTRCRLLLSDLTALPEYAAKLEANEFGFLRGKTAFDRCMRMARERFSWEHRQLR